MLLEQITKIIVPQGAVCEKLTCIAQGKSQDSKVVTDSLVGLELSFQMQS